MTQPTAASHSCYPLWTATGPRATCTEHFWQPVGITAVAEALAEQARHVQAKRVRRHNRAAAQR